MKPKTEKEKKKEPPKKDEKCICEICTCGYVKSIHCATSLDELHLSQDVEP